MRKQRSGSVWMILPLYIFTLIFVAGPLLYVLALSFAKPAPTHGIEWTFSWDNYRKILEPVYLSTFAGSFRLAVTSTFFICLIGYPFGYFMAKLSDKWKKRAMIFLMLPFWVNSLIRLYGCMIILQTKGVLNHVLKTLGIIEKPLRILYSYPAIVVGMIYVLLPFMILSVYSSAEKMDWSLVEAARDLGASPFKAFWTVRSDPYFYSFHGSVFYCRYPWGKQNRAGGKFDPGTDDKRQQLALCSSTGSGSDGIDYPYDPFVP